MKEFYRISPKSFDDITDVVRYVIKDSNVIINVREVDEQASIDDVLEDCEDGTRPFYIRGPVTTYIKGNTVIFLSTSAVVMSDTVSNAKALYGRAITNINGFSTHGRIKLWIYKML